MKTKLLLLFFFTFLFSQAQKGVISGKVVDVDDKLPLPGALVQIVGMNKYAVTDNTGRYEFLNVYPGNYSLQIKYM